MTGLMFDDHLIDLHQLSFVRVHEHRRVFDTSCFVKVINHPTQST